MILNHPRRLAVLWLLAPALGLVACGTDSAGANGVESAAAETPAEAPAPAFDLADAVAWALRTADGRYLLTLQRDESYDYRRPGKALRGSLLDLQNGRAAVDLLLTDAEGDGSWTSGASASDFRSVTLNGVPGWATAAAPGARLSGRIDGEALSFDVSPLALAIVTRERNTVNVEYGDSIDGEYRLDIVRVPAGEPAAERVNDALWANLQPGRTSPPRDATAAIEDTLDTWAATHAEWITFLADRPRLEPGRGSTYGETLTRSQRLIAADDTLLAVSTLEYSFTKAAAHSTYGYRFVSIDRRTGEPFGINAAGLPAADRQRLQRALDAAAYRYISGNDMDPGVDLTRYYNTAHIPVTDNAARIPGGWVFGYDPYEITSGATSDINLVVWDKDWRG